MTTNPSPTTATEPSAPALLPSGHPAFYTHATLAADLGIAESTLRWHRMRGTGPRGFTAPGTRRVLYPAHEVEAWLRRGFDAQHPDAASA